MTCFGRHATEDAVVEDGHPVWEYTFPAALLNTYATLRLVPKAEVDELLEAVCRRGLRTGHSPTGIPSLTRQLSATYRTSCG